MSFARITVDPKTGTAVATDMPIPDDLRLTEEQRAAAILAEKQRVREAHFYGVVEEKVPNLQHAPVMQDTLTEEK